MTGLGKSVRLFLVDGTPGGLITAEIMNWTGQVLAAPRSDLAALVKRDETQKTGVYLLVGEDSERPELYVGESDDVARRLAQHARGEDAGGKDFWVRAIVLTSKDMNLTKAHAKYLESRLIELAAEAARARVTNGNTPPLPPLPEADRSDMEFFVEQAKIVLPVLSVNALRPTRSVRPFTTSPASAGAAPTESPLFELSSRQSDRGVAEAEGQEVDGEFIVREGAKARLTWAGGMHSYQKLRLDLEEMGILQKVPDGSAMVLTKDHAFSSPTAAAACILGRSTNGRVSWRVRGSRTTYAEWQEGLLQAAEVGHPGDAFEEQGIA